LKKLFDVTDSLIKYLSFIVLSIMSVSAFLQVLYRYVIESSLSWTDELTRYLFIWLIFIGVAFSVRRDGHIAIESIFLFLKDHQKNGYKRIIYIIQIIFFLFLSVIGFYFVITNFGNVSPGLQLPMGFVYLALPVGSIFSIIFLLEKIIYPEKGAEG
jgi:TRAP-type transport system small permease protein